jgi:hypothetical protein
MPSHDSCRSSRRGAQPLAPIPTRAIRKRSDYEYLGMPLWSVAIGWAAIGGAAVGYYAAGGAAWGTYVVSAIERSPETIAFFTPCDVVRDVVRTLVSPNMLRR